MSEALKRRVHKAGVSYVREANGTRSYPFSVNLLFPYDDEIEIEGDVLRAVRCNDGCPAFLAELDPIFEKKPDPEQKIGASQSVEPNAADPVDCTVVSPINQAPFSNSSTTSPLSDWISDSSNVLKSIPSSDGSRRPPFVKSLEDKIDVPEASTLSITHVRQRVWGERSSLIY